MKIRKSSFWIIASLLATHLAHSSAQASVNRCEAVFNKGSTLDGHGLRTLAPQTVRMLGLIHEQKAVIQKITASLDPKVAANYLMYLDAYARHLADPLNTRSNSPIHRPSASELRLIQQLEEMKSAAQEIQAIHYPKEEIAEKLAERKQVSDLMRETERLWWKHTLIEKDRILAEETKKNSRNDGKGSASAGRALTALTREAKSVQESAADLINRSTLQEYEKATLNAFFDGRDLDGVIAMIFNSSTVHLSAETRAALRQAGTKEAAFSAYLEHLRNRHANRLQREIDVTLETYSMVAYKYYALLFHWGRQNRFKQHSDILDIDLRDRLVHLEAQLRDKTANLERDRQNLRDLWAQRERILGMIHAVETYMGNSEGNLIAASVRGQTVTSLGALFKELQEVEDRIGAHFPAMSQHDRMTLVREEGLTAERLIEALNANLKVAQEKLKKLIQEKEAWIANHQPSTFKDNDDDIELF